MIKYYYNLYKKLPIHKKVIFSLLIPSLTFIVLYEYFLIKCNSYNEIYYKAGIISQKISYSILASSIFYIITQYYGVNKPKFDKKIKLYLIFKHSINQINENINSLKYSIGINDTDYKDFNKLDEKLTTINTDHIIGSYMNWHQYLYSFKVNILQYINRLIIYQEYLDEDIIIELNILEQQLTKSHLFSAFKTNMISNLSIGTLEIQEIFIHNDILQNLINMENKRLSKYTNKYISKYRGKNFNNY